MTDILIKPLEDAQDAPEDSPDATGEVEAVDRPDNPLADWLTVPDVPILPVWARNWASLRANTGAFAKVTWWHSRYHALRSPKYAVKIVGYSARGAFRGGRRLWPVLATQDHTRAIKALRAQAKAKPEDTVLAAQAVLAHRERTVARRWRWGTALTLATAAAVALNYASLGLQFAAGCLMCGGLTAIGWSDEAQILDHGTPPLRIAMDSQQLNDALRATGLLKQGKGDDEGPKVNCIMGPLRDGNGWAVVFDLPRGGGKKAPDVLAKRVDLAAELGVDEIQVIMSRVRAAHGGNAGRVSMWVADDDPYLAPPTTSPLEALDSFSIWDAIPFGQDARGNRVSIPIVWQSMFFGGLPRRGKTFSQRLLTAAGLLDPYVRHYVADFKGGQDWIQMRQVAHRLVLGAEEDAIEAFKALLKELLAEMERRFALLRGLPTSICPEGKLTPEIVKRYNMPFILFTVDELQEAFLAVDDQEREEIINDMARIARRGPAAGFISNYASQRPDAKSVPTKLREIITIRYSTQVTDQTSSDMVLGKGKAAQGADASVLSEEHKGVGVLVTGPASFVTVKADMLETAGFNAMCAKGRALREQAGTLTGDAANDPSAIAEASGVTVSPVLSDCLSVMRHSVKMHTADILVRLENLDEDYGDWDAERLAKELDDAGVKRTTKQVNIGGKNLAGYRREDLEAAMPAELLNTR
ncbi:cell division protein FtsK [Streptomyces sp. WAC 01529]|uniref:cell division protein FtsK n=1 Tax=Streptomyces sp. WAC 01529 TaxID=2203205 RepID=UPI000F6DDB7A|nr:cell division protein FtsK [Streptomyces sp. WAC 01529]AZM54153.1 cell division protein FtsK [Streptomyces sp. WAC 01529]